MSWSVGGVTFTPQSATYYASQMFAAINAQRQAVGLPQMVATSANALWLMCLAAGNVRADYDLQLNAAGNSFEISVADDNQILNLLPAVGTSLVPPTYTTLTIQVTATSGGSCTVPAGTLARFTNTINFSVNTTTVVPASSTVSIATTCTVSGPVAVVPGQVTSFTTSLANLASVNNSGASIQGSAQETVSQLRTRILQGNVLNWGINGLIRALRAIQGITQATAYFNPDAINPITINGVTVNARHCHMYVIGSDPTGVAIANAYSQTMNAPTDGSQSQNFITLAGQNIAINYDLATTQAVYVKVFYDSTLPTQAGYDTQIKNLVLTLAPTIGQAITTEFILSVLQNFIYASIVTATVSSDNITYVNRLAVNGNAVATFTTANIFVVGTP